MKKLSALILIAILMLALVCLTGCSQVIEGIANSISAGLDKDTPVIDFSDTEDPVDKPDNAMPEDIEEYVADNPYNDLDFSKGNQVALANGNSVTAEAIAANYDSSSAVMINAVNLSGEVNAVTEAAPALSNVLAAAAPGTVVYSNSKAAIDASNTADGYIMVAYTGGASSKIKVLIDCPSGIRYTYDLNAYGSYEAFPLSDGNGSYTIGIYENISGSQYATAYTNTVSVALSNQFAPFLRPNQYVNFTTGSATANQAAYLCSGLSSELDKVTAIYNYVVTNFTYDRELAANVQSGYIPNLDTVLANKKGICFDYAALMTAMLRCQGVPTKLVIGYSGTAYHAWISTYTESQGWVNGVIHFDGNQWKLMDPTFASTGNSSSQILQYIGNGSNYSAKFLY